MNQCNVFANVSSIETMGLVDGPGIRVVIFLQGCNLRCAYCHNPDTWDMSAGEIRTVESIANDILRYTRYISGVTVSGGEPLLQMDFVIELFKKVKSLGLSTCLDTSGIVFNRQDSNILSKFQELIKVCDIVMLDIKHIDEQSHISLTGKSNKNVLDFAMFLSENSVETWIRYVLVPGINSSENILKKTREILDNFKSVKKIEVLPYHRLGVEKYKKLGIEYQLSDIKEPTDDEIKLANLILNKNN